MSTQIQQQEQQPKPQIQEQTNLRSCPHCGHVFSKIGFVDHLFASKDCMRKFWDEEEKDGAARRRLRLQNARKAEAAAAMMH